MPEGFGLNLTPKIIGINNMINLDEAYTMYSVIIRLGINNATRPMCMERVHINAYIDSNNVASFIAILKDSGNISDS